MLDFMFSLPTRVIFGREAVKEIPGLIKQGGFKKVLLHSYDEESLKGISIFQEVKALLEETGIAYAQLLGVKPNPTLSFIGEGIEFARREQIDFILAVGGGSVIDSAKGIALGVHTSLEEVWEYAKGSKEPEPANTVKVGCVLSAAAAGSETSTATVITNEAENLKRGAHHEANRPYFAVMNPEATYTVPPFQTACGVFDSIMHVCERYFTSTKDAALTDRIAEAIMKSVIEAGFTVMKKPDDYEARAALMWGASMAHNNIISCGRIKGSGIHLIEEELHSVNNKIVHGAGLSVLFPAWARQVCRRNVPRFAQFAARVMNIDYNFENPGETALKGIEAMEEYISFLGLPRSLRDIGIAEEQFEAIADLCTVGGRTVSNLCELTRQDIMEILRRAA